MPRGIFPNGNKGLFKSGHKLGLGKKRTITKEQKERLAKLSEPYRFKKGHTVSQEIRNKIGTSNKGNKWGFYKGHKFSRGSNSGKWKGDNVGYSGLHYWVKKIFPKTEFCNECKKSKPMDLANKGIYDRNIENWEWLCRRCHMTKDGRIYKNLKQWRLRVNKNCQKRGFK